MTIYLNLMVGWLAILSGISFVLMGIDKSSAKLQQRRISEKTLWLSGLFGGWFGLTLGGLVFRHKVAKRKFWIPVIFAMLLWIVLIYIFLTVNM
jgi:uncharacterized membrane protein YsdA (DUF1294 family)